MAKVLVNFPDEFLEEVDKVAEFEHRTRSSLIREALRRYISQRNEKPEEAPATISQVANGFQL